MKHVPDRRPQRVFDEFMRWNVHQLDATAFEELRVCRAYAEEVSACELRALLPAPKAEMLDGNRRRLIDVVARKECADGNVTIVTVVKLGSGAEHMVEAPDFFNHVAPYRNACPETTHVSRVVHRRQHPVAGANEVWNKAGSSVMLPGLDTTKGNRDLGVCDEN
jgi:hypothetical protein